MHDCDFVLQDRCRARTPSDDVMQTKPKVHPGFSKDRGAVGCARIIQLRDAIEIGQMIV